MIDRRLPLAELHLHLYGTIRAEDYLERLTARAAAIDWSFYEKTYERAYGGRPPVRDILERHQAGDPDAASAFRDLFVFGNADAGNFQENRIQTWGDGRSVVGIGGTGTLNPRNQSQGTRAAAAG